MRETARQLALALALPVAVAAFWAVRGDVGRGDSLERASAYRAALAELPLPTPVRLRRPVEASDWRIASRVHEEPAGRSRRASPPDLPGPTPVDLAPQARSRREDDAAPSPRAPETAPLAPAGAPVLALGESPVPDATRSTLVVGAHVARVAASPAESGTSDAGVKSVTTDAPASARTAAPTSATQAVPAPATPTAPAIARAATTVSPAQLRQTLSAAPALPPASVKAIPARIEDPKALVEAPVHRAQEPARPQPVVTEREPAPDELELALPLEPSRISLPETAQTILAALPAAEHAFADRNDAPWIPVTPESETREVGFAVSVPGLQRFATPAVQDFASDFSMPVPPHALFAPTTTPRLIPEPDSALLLGAALTAIAVGRRSLRRP